MTTSRRRTGISNRRQTTGSLVVAAVLANVGLLAIVSTSPDHTPSPDASSMATRALGAAPCAPPPQRCSEPATPEEAFVQGQVGLPGAC